MKVTCGVAQGSWPILSFCHPEQSEGFKTYPPLKKGSCRKAAFTLSEILLVIAVIGIVAILIIPSFIRTTKDLEYTTARKRVLATVGEALKQIAVQGNIRDAADAEDFVNNYLSKQLKIAKTCDNDNLQACGIEIGENKILDLGESKKTMPTKIADLTSTIGLYVDRNSTSYGFVMANGYSMNLFYNPNCRSTNNFRYACCNDFAADNVCVNVIYDINGRGKPNQMGKDIGFVTLVYPDSEAQAVAFNVSPQQVSANYFNAGKVCSSLGKDYVPPSLAEMSALQYNNNLLINNGGAGSFGTTFSNNNDSFVVFVWNRDLRATGKSNAVWWRCIKR